jgi:hypothetical protein
MSPRCSHAIEQSFAAIAADVPSLFDLSKSADISACRDYVVSRLERATGYAVGCKVQMKVAGAPDNSMDRLIIRIDDRMRLTFYRCDKH